MIIDFVITSLLNKVDDQSAPEDLRFDAARVLFEISRTQKDEDLKNTSVELLKQLSREVKEKEVYQKCIAALLRIHDQEKFEQNKDNFDLQAKYL